MSRLEDLAQGLNNLGCAPMSAQRTVDALFEQIEQRHQEGAKLIDIWEYLATQIGVAPSSLSNCWARAKRNRRREGQETLRITVPPLPTNNERAPHAASHQALRRQEPPRTTAPEPTTQPKPGTFTPWADREP